MVTVPSTARMAETAAPSAPFLSPRPTQREAASAAASVTRTSSIARLRSGRRDAVGMAAAYWPPPDAIGGDPSRGSNVPAVLEWNPNDPETVKVHYDVSGWSVDQRAELAEALAEAELAHVWEGEEVVVPEELEAEVDELFGRLEELLGPFAVGLAEDDPGVEYGLDEWPTADRQTLAQALVEGEVPHRWTGATLVAATDAEATVDELLDAIEQGTLVSTSPGAGAPEGALDALFSSSDRLARDADDRSGRDDLEDIVERIDAAAPPYGIAVGSWARTVQAAQHLRDLVADDGSSSSDVIGAAQEVRSLVKQYVA